VAAALRWFERTHEVVSTGFSAYWRLAWLPSPGSVSEQDAWLWEALRLIKAECNQQLRESAGRDELSEWRDRKRRELGG
jgi:hypothetical protein